MATGAGATLGIAGVLLSVHIHAASAVWVKRIGASVPALETTTGALLIAAPLFLLNWALLNWALLEGELPTELEPRTTLSIVHLAVFGSALGFILYYHVLGHVEASRVALITPMTPVLARFLGQEVNGETIGPRELAGTAVILAGLACYQRGDRWIERRA